MQRKRITKFEIKYVIVIITIAFVFIAIDLIQIKNENKITITTGVDSIYLQKENVIYNRGAISIKDVGSFPSVLEVIFNPQGFNGWDYAPPLVKFPGYNHIPKIAEVPLPFVFFKRENSDTVVVRKDSFLLYFRFEEFKDL
jgi:hypothetical protein